MNAMLTAPLMEVEVVRVVKEMYPIRPRGRMGLLHFFIRNTGELWAQRRLQAAWTS